MFAIVVLFGVLAPPFVARMTVANNGGIDRASRQANVSSQGYNEAGEGWGVDFYVRAYEVQYRC